MLRHTTSRTLVLSQHYTRRTPFAWRIGVLVKMRVGREAIEKAFESEFAASWRAIVGKLVQIYAIEDRIAAISEYRFGGWHGHRVGIYVRDADTWKIRMEFVTATQMPE